MSYQIKETTDPCAVVVLSPVDGGANVCLVRDGRSEALGYFCDLMLPVFLGSALRRRGLSLVA